MLYFVCQCYEHFLALYLFFFFRLNHFDAFNLPVCALLCSGSVMTQHYRMQ